MASGLVRGLKYRTVAGALVVAGAVLGGAVLDGSVLDVAVLDGSVLDGSVLGGSVLGGSVLDVELPYSVEPDCAGVPLAPPPASPRPAPGFGARFMLLETLVDSSVMAASTLSALPLICVGLPISVVSMSMVRPVRIRLTRPSDITKPVTAYCAPKILPRRGAVLGKTWPSLVRFCSASTSLRCSRSTRRIFELDARSVMSRSWMPVDTPS